jgi:alkylated DNA repair protein alkB family protein 6
MTSTAGPSDDGGRPIAAIPLAHILLEPRSLLVITSSLYTSHLHGIQPLEADIIGGADGVEIANRALLGQSVEDGAVLQRSTRTSLTFRAAERVLKIQGVRKG